jgi:excisionase family DNA binding protein
MARSGSQVQADNSRDADSLAPLLVTAPQAARILSIGRTALYQLIWDGQLTPIHIGRSVRFSLNQLNQFVEERLDSTPSLIVK